MWTHYLADVSHTLGFALFWLAAAGWLFVGNYFRDGWWSFLPCIVLAAACGVLGSAQWW